MEKSVKQIAHISAYHMQGTIPGTFQVNLILIIYEVDTITISVYR
jgi:hypothetical protein